MKREFVTRSARHAGGVLRYHSWPTIRTQTVADHTFNILRIYCQIFGPPDASVTVAIMGHDLGEIGAGDPPFPSKRDNPVLAEEHNRIEEQTVRDLHPPIPLSPDIPDAERFRIKVCDLLEMWEFGLIELRLGNLYAEPIVKDTYSSAMQVGAFLVASDRELINNFIRETRL